MHDGGGRGAGALSAPEAGKAGTHDMDDTQLLLLSSIVYSFGRDVEGRPGQTLAEMLLDVDSAMKHRMVDEGLGMDEVLGQSMTYAQWFAIVDAARRDRELAALRLDAVEVDELEARLACFGDTRGDAVVVLGGTGRGEWKDDFTAAYVADSPQQLRALEWFGREVAPRGYRGIVACGHSKGGNKALYLALRTGQIERAVSFDGEGMSREFRDAYADDVERLAPRLWSISHEGDYVNGMLNPVVPETHRRYIRGADVGNAGLYHTPWALFAAQEPGSCELALGRDVEQSDTGRLAVQLTDYLQDELSHDDFVCVCSAIGDVAMVLRTLREDDGESVRAKLKGAVDAEGFGLAMSSVVSFAHSIGRDATPLELFSLVIPEQRMPEPLRLRLRAGV